jgi:hypothetical protein
MTPSGIEPGTFRFVAQYLNHCATAAPQHNGKYDNIIILWDHRLICCPSLTETSLCGAYLYSRAELIFRSFGITDSLNIIEAFKINLYVRNGYFALRFACHSTHIPVVLAGTLHRRRNHGEKFKTHFMYLFSRLYNVSTSSRAH